MQFVKYNNAALVGHLLFMVPRSKKQSYCRVKSTNDIWYAWYNTSLVTPSFLLHLHLASSIIPTKSPQGSDIHIKGFNQLIILQS